MTQKITKYTQTYKSWLKNEKMNKQENKKNNFVNSKWVVTQSLAT